MGYEINVAHNGKHFFATDESRCDSLSHAKKIYESLCKHYRPEDGYELTVTYRLNVGKDITKEFSK